MALGNNCVAFIFDEIRYELNNVEIDRNRNVDITSTLINYVTMSSDRFCVMPAGMCKLLRWDTLISVYVLLGFCEDYKHMIINICYELILI